MADDTVFDPMASDNARIFVQEQHLLHGVSSEEDERPVVKKEHSEGTTESTVPMDNELMERIVKIPDQPFRIMDLPLEVRTMVFKEFLVMPGPILSRREAYFEGKYQTIPPFAKLPWFKFEQRGWWGSGSCEEINESSIIRQSDLLNIFSASKTIYRETVPLYFGCNTFEFRQLDDFEKFVTKIGAEYRWQLARVSIHRYRGRAPARAVKHLVTCVGLRELTLNMDGYSIATFSNVPPYNFNLYGMKDLLRIRGLTNLQVISQEADHEKAIGAFKKQLEVVKQPHHPKNLKRQENKDFPAKAKRRVLGSANVVTRGEKRMLEEQQGTASS